VATNSKLANGIGQNPGCNLKLAKIGKNWQKDNEKIYRIYSLNKKIEEITKLST